MLNKEDTFQKLINENSERIRRICRYYNANAEDQKDMYQEVLINIWKSLDSFKGNAQITTWIYRVAVNTALSYTGKSFKEMKMLVNTPEEYFRLLVDEESSSEKWQEEKNYHELQNALNLLSVIDKALISLTLEGISMKEIADVIGMTEANVKVKIHRIKSQLRNQLKK